RFLASEYITGKTHRGRIDTLGVDENNNPVILEYKRSINENVVTQGLFYLDWLLDHQAEFALLAMKKLGPSLEDQIDWSSPRLVCIAGDFTRYDEHAITHIDRNIELIRYRRYGDEFVLFELINSRTPAESKPKSSATSATVTPESLAKDYLAKASPELKDLYAEVEAFLSALGDDVQVKALKHYFVFRRLRNFACVEVHAQVGKLTIYARVNPDSVALEEGFTRDVREIGHLGTGDLEISVKGKSDFERAKPLLLTAYESS